MDILRISVLGVGGVLLGIFLKDRAPEYVSLITMGIGLVIRGLQWERLVIFLIRWSG